jgi:hypothetical protein
VVEADTIGKRYGEKPDLIVKFLGRKVDQTVKLRLSSLLVASREVVSDAFRDAAPASEPPWHATSPPPDVVSCHAGRAGVRHGFRMGGLTLLA